MWTASTCGQSKQQQAVMRNHELGCLVTATCCPTCCLQNQCTQLPQVRCHSGRHLCTNTGSLLCISHQKEMSSSTCARFPHQINNAADAPIRGSTTHPNRHYVHRPPQIPQLPTTRCWRFPTPEPTEQVTRAHYLKAPEPGCSVNSTSQRACKLKNPLDLRLAQTAHTSTVLANCAWAPETL